mgnify:CR=1 FL=1
MPLIDRMRRLRKSMRYGASLNYEERVRVLAYASPPCVDLATSRRIRPFVTTIVNRTDVIPRSSLVNL